MIMQSCAKWVLSGEYCVLYGSSALAFPLKNYYTTLQYENANKLEINDLYKGEQETISELINLACEFLNININFKGKIIVNSAIPVKSGLGSSAALCSCIAKLFCKLNMCDKPLLLAQFLEHYFHKVSSGLDCAVALLEKPMIYTNIDDFSVFDVNFWPHFVLTYSGEQSLTSQCVESVNMIRNSDINNAHRLNTLANETTQQCVSALKTEDLSLLARSINVYAEIFDAFGLINKSLKQHIGELKRLGAIAAKPVGSGLGGYVLSLWNPCDTQKIKDLLKKNTHYYGLLIKKP